MHPRYAIIKKFEDQTKESNAVADQADCDIRFESLTRCSSYYFHQTENKRKIYKTCSFLIHKKIQINKLKNYAGTMERRCTALR